MNTFVLEFHCLFAPFASKGNKRSSRSNEKRADRFGPPFFHSVQLKLASATAFGLVASSALTTGVTAFAPLLAHGTLTAGLVALSALAAALAALTTHLAFTATLALRGAVFHAAAAALLTGAPFGATALGGVACCTGAAGVATLATVGHGSGLALFPRKGGGGRKGKSGG